MERTNEEDLYNGRICQQQWSEHSSINEDEQSENCYQFCRFIKSTYSRCCSFSYKNSSQLSASFSFGLVFILGVLKVVFGSLSLASGQAAIFLAKQSNLHWCGVFLVRNWCCGVGDNNNSYFI